MATTIVKINHTDNLSAMLSRAASLAKPFAMDLVRVVNGFASGNYLGTMQASYAEASGVKATGTVTISSGSGTVSITINGVAFSRTWATDDTTTAAAFATDINASSNALITGIVTATSALGVVTITAVEKTKSGNAITTAAAGNGMTANQARLTGGVTPVFTTYAFS